MSLEKYENLNSDFEGVENFTVDNPIKDFTYKSINFHDEYYGYSYNALYNVFILYGKHSIINDKIFFMREKNPDNQPCLTFYRPDEHSIVESLFPLFEMDLFEAFVFLIEERKLIFPIKNFHMLYEKTKSALLYGVRANVSFKYYIHTLLKRELEKTSNRNPNIIYWSKDWLFHIFYLYQNVFINLAGPQYEKLGMICYSNENNKCRYRNNNEGLVSGESYLRLKFKNFFSNKKQEFIM
jgi:hypothetical protein